MLDSWLQGHRRNIWVTKNAPLLEDARRDWTALGGLSGDIQPISNWRIDEPIRLDQGVLLVTYPTLRSMRGDHSRLKQIVDWAGAGFEGVIAFDEAHEMGGVAGGEGALGAKEGSQQGICGVLLEAEMQGEELSENAFKALDQEEDRLIAEAEAIENRAPVLPDALKPHVGAFLLLTPQGEMRLDTRYYSEQEILIEAPGGDDAAGEDGDVDGDTGDRGASGGFRIGGNGPTEPTYRPEAVAPGGKPLSARLYDELAIQRRDILASCVLAQPALALDYALFVMVDARTSSPGRYGLSSTKYGTTIRASGPQDPTTGDMPSTRAREYLAEAHDGLDAAWTEHEGEVDRFKAFRALDDDSKANWLAYIVALSLEAKPGFSNEQIPLHNRMAAILEVDVASWWRPTSENFFDRVNKGSILSLLHDVGGPALTARHASLKKSEISESCQKLFAGESIVEPEVKAAALAWVPSAMRFLDGDVAPTADSSESGEEETRTDEVSPDDATFDEDDEAAGEQLLTGDADAPEPIAA